MSLREGFEFQKVKARLGVTLFLLAVDSSVEFNLQLLLKHHVCCVPTVLPCHDDNGLSP